MGKKIGCTFKVQKNQKFGDWTIINSEPIRNEKGYYFFKCACKCGTERLVVSSNLKRGISTNCGCKIKGKPAHNYQGIGDLSQKYFNRLKNGALQRNILFNITIQQAYNLFTGYCNISSLPISFSRLTLSTQTASLDRIDSSKGYIEGNVQWVHKNVNIMKNKLNQDYFINICKMIANNN